MRTPAKTVTRAPHRRRRFARTGMGCIRASEMSGNGPAIGSVLRGTRQRRWRIPPGRKVVPAGSSKADHFCVICPTAIATGIPRDRKIRLIHRPAIPGSGVLWMCEGRRIRRVGVNRRNEFRSATLFGSCEKIERGRGLFFYLFHSCASVKVNAY